MSPNNLFEYLPTALFPVTWLALALAAAGALLAPLVVWVAHRRTSRQPLLLPIVEEQHLLARMLTAIEDRELLVADAEQTGQWLLIDHPDHDTGRKSNRTRGLDGPLRLVPPGPTHPQGAVGFETWGVDKSLTADSFACHAHSELFAAILGHLGDTDVSTESIVASAVATSSDPQALAVALEAITQLSRDPAQVTSDLDQDDANASQNSRPFRPLLPRPIQATLVELAETIEMSHEDRTRFGGRVAIQPTDTPASIDADRPPLHRVVARPRLVRYLATAVLMATMFALIPAFIAVMVRPGWGQTHTLTTIVLSGLAFAVLVIASMIIAWVDVDTMYVDLATLGAGTLLSWGLTAATLVLFGEPQRLLLGLGGVVAVVIVFEVFNMAYRLIRGRDGQGFGDTLVIAMTLGVPVALTGVLSLAIWIVLAAQLTGMIAAVVRGLLPQGDLRAPFAFVPWLTAGWVLALIVLVADVNRVLIVR